MKREFLKSLELADEVIDKIMAENGKDIEGTKSKYVDYKDVKRQLVAANEQIGKFKGMDVEAVKKAAEDWKVKAEKAASDTGLAAALRKNGCCVLTSISDRWKAGTVSLGMRAIVGKSRQSVRSVCGPQALLGFPILQ